jgi:murein DD-endopeptidase MepM/ murein hydrolase activator NlpD
MFFKTKFRPSRNSFKIFALLALIGYLSGYQPVWGIPPIRQSQVHASNSQVIQITAQSFSTKPQLPHPGYLSTRYSTWHPGVDIATGLGMPIRPILTGRVTEATFSFWGLGHYVTVEHELGYKSTYGHMGRIYVKPGDVVNESTILGEVGLTGNTSGPHTHMELTRNGQYINPEAILPKIPSWNEYSGIPNTQNLGTGNR